MIGAGAGGVLAAVDPTDVLLAVIGGVFTLMGIAWTVRGNRQVRRLTTEEGAYTRARETDDGMMGRLEKERDYLTGQLTAERAGRAEDNARWEAKEAKWEAREAALIAEAARLEERVREVLDELVSLRQRHEQHDRERPRRP